MTNYDEPMWVPMPESGILTHEAIAQAESGHGGFKKAQLDEWGVPWPPPGGWKDVLMGASLQSMSDLVARQRVHQAPKVQSDRIARRTALRARVRATEVCQECGAQLNDKCRSLRKGRKVRSANHISRYEAWKQHGSK